MAVQETPFRNSQGNDMSSFDEWYKSNAEYTPEPGYGFVGWTDKKLKEAYNAGMERAAEITESFPDASNRGALVLCAEVIRKEIEK